MGPMVQHEQWMLFELPAASTTGFLPKKPCCSQGPWARQVSALSSSPHLLPNQDRTGAELPQPKASLPCGLRRQIHPRDLLGQSRGPLAFPPSSQKSTQNTPWTFLGAIQLSYKRNRGLSRVCFLPAGPAASFPFPLQRPAGS